MTAYVSQPITMREIPGVGAVVQSGGGARVAGSPWPILAAETVLGNPDHYVRTAYPTLFAKMQAGEVAAVVMATLKGRPAHIVLTPEQFALGAPERARYAEWCAGNVAREAARQAAEREYDAGHNEGGEGYNPHRRGSERTYARVAPRDRDYPAGA